MDLGFFDIELINLTNKYSAPTMYSQREIKRDANIYP